jgi:hypothetical protein
MSIRTAMCLVIAICSFSCNSTCSDKNIEHLMGSYYKKNILFPEKLELLRKAKSNNKSFDKVPIGASELTVIHFFSADCDECVNNLLLAQKFIQKNTNLCNVQYLFIASGPSKYYAENAIKKIHFKYPVYYEHEYFSYKKINALPVSDVLYNTLLINKKGQMLLFGGFFDNDKAYDLFTQIVKCTQCNQ